MKRIILPFLSVLLVFASCKKEKTPAPPVVTDPAITAISPTSGQKNTVVTITGTNFGTSTTALKVYFNGVQGVVQTATGNSITASVPVGAQTGIVKVEKNAVQVNGPQFTYLPRTPPALLPVLTRDMQTVTVLQLHFLFLPV